MKRTLPALAAGALAALGIYGILWAFGREVETARDPWLEAFTDAGLRVECGILSATPEKNLLFVEGRALFARPEARGASLREYRIEDIRTQVVILPSAGVLPELPQGRHGTFKLRPKGGTTHLCRKGRFLLLMSTNQGTSLFRVPTELIPVGKAFAAFEGAAGEAGEAP
jgi:hypothetical protein